LRGGGRKRGISLRPVSEPRLKERGKVSVCDSSAVRRSGEVASCTKFRGGDMTVSRELPASVKRPVRWW